MIELKELPGMDEESLEKLSRAGITSITTLQTYEGNLEGMQKLADSTEMPLLSIQQWVDYALVEKGKSNPIKYQVDKLVVKVRYLLKEKLNFQTLLVILTLVAATLGAQAATQSSKAGGYADIREWAALKAAISEGGEKTRIHSVAYNHYTSYIDYAVNDELVSLYKSQMVSASAQELPDLQDQLDESEQLAAINRTFFPSKYIEPDGTYNIERELGELWSEATLNKDIDPDSYFVRADRFGTRSELLSVLPILSNTALLLFSIVQGLHEERKRLRKFIMYLGIGVILALAARFVYIIMVYGYSHVG